MKTIALTFILLLFSTVICAADTASSGSTLKEGLVNPGYHEKPDWFKESFLDIREDIEEATEAEKRLILYFYQDGCPYCEKLLKDNFGNQQIADATQAHFDVIAINMWGDREVTGFEGESTREKDFAAALKVQYTPTLLMLDEEGNIVFRINGYFDPARFAVALNYVAGKHEKSGSIQDYYNKLQADQQAENNTEKTIKTTKKYMIAESLPHPLKLKDDRRDSGRPLMLMVEQTDCADCEELHNDILKRHEVALSLSNLDVAQLDLNNEDTIQTPDGREIPAADWLKELTIKYTPSLIFFNKDGKEVFRTEGYLKTFHIHGAMDYVIAGAYQWQPEFQRFLQHRTDILHARGFEVDLLD